MTSHRSHLVALVRLALSLAMIAALAAATSACDDDLGTGDSGILLTFPRAEITFGTVSLGETERENLALTNEGSGNLRILEVRWEGSQDIALEFPEGDPTDRTLAPGGEEVYTLVVAYSPRLDVAETGGEVVIDSTDPNSPETRIPVVAQALGARIQVTPSSVEKLNFGSVGLGETETRVVSVTNVGVLPLEIYNIIPPPNAEFTVDFPDGVAFPRPENDPFVIADTSESLEFEVTYSPQRLGEDLGSILIENNDERLPNYELPIVADSSAPCIRVSEELVEFTPAIAINDVETRVIIIESCGGVPLTVEGIEKVAGGSAAIFKNEIEPIDNLVLAPDDIATFEILYAPQTEGFDTAQFVVRSNDTLRGEVTIDVLGESTSNRCPEASAQVRLQGSPVLSDQLEANPLDNVVLDGTASSDPESSVEEYRWELRGAPTDSTTFIDDHNDGIAELFLDLAGDYEVCLTVVDAQQTESCNESCVQIRARPSEKIHVQLVWHTPEDEVVGNNDGADVDLHFTRVPQGTWGDAGTAAQQNGWDIFFENREATWLVENGAPENPSLDRDDRDGEGPENVNLDDPNPCSWYAVGVHYFDDKGFNSSYATVRVYINGDKRFEKVNIPLDVGAITVGDFWQVAFIHWDGTTARVFDASERYFNGEWIGTSPTIPQAMQDVIDSSVPACAETAP